MLQSYVIYKTLEAAKKSQHKLEEYYPGFKWIRLLTRDGYIFDVVAPLFDKCKVINNMMEGLQLASEFTGIRNRSSVFSIVINDMPINLSFNGSNIESALDVLNYIAHNEPIDMSEYNIDILLAMMKIADFLDCDQLLNLVIKELDSQMAGCNPEQLRERFNIANDFKKEEHDQIVNEGLWSFNQRITGN